MSDSQKFIARNRAPRVQIEYDVELYGAQKKVQLPFVMGVLSDLSGTSEQPAVADRGFLEIDIDNFDDRMRAMAPKAQFSVPNTLTGEGSLAVDLTFEKMSDFSPEAIARKVAPLRPLLEARQQLVDLMAYMDGKSGAEALIEQLLSQPGLLQTLTEPYTRAEDREAALETLRSALPETVEPEEASTANALQSLAAQAPAEAPPDTSVADALGSLGPAPEEEASDTTAEALASLQAARVAEPEPIDGTADILSGLEAPVAEESPDETADDVLSRMDRATDEAPPDDVSDVLSEIQRVAPPEPVADDTAEILAGIDATAPAPEEGDSDDILSALEMPELSDPSTPSVDALLAGIDRAETAPEPEDDLDDILAELDAPVPETVTEEADDILAGLDSPAEDTAEDDLDALLVGLEAPEIEVADEGEDLDTILQDVSTSDLAREETAGETDDPLVVTEEPEAGDDLDALLAGLETPETGEADEDADLEAILEDDSDPDPPHEVASAETDDPLVDEEDPEPGDDDLDALLAGLDAVDEDPPDAEVDDLETLFTDLDAEPADDPAGTEDDDDLDALMAALDQIEGALEDAEAGTDDVDSLLADLDETQEAPDLSDDVAPAPAQLAFGRLTAERPEREALNRNRFRMAIFGDFTGRAARGVKETGNALAARKPIALDVDTLDDVIEGFGTTLTLPIGKDGSGVSVKLSELDDLHPDELYDNLDLFAEISGLRQQLGTGAMTEKTIQRLKNWSEDYGKPIRLPKRSGATSIPAHVKLSDFQSLIGDTAGRLTEAGPADHLIAQIVGPHVIKAPDAGVGAMTDAVDQALSTAMRLVLHHPDFQAIEAQWRSLDLLARRIETDSDLEIVLYDVSAEELAVDLAANEDLSESGLFRLLTDVLDPEEGAGGFSALFGLYTFEETPPHAELLARIGQVAAHVDAPFFAAMTPAYLDVAKEDRHPLVAKAWDTLRALPEAGYLGLAAPRFLLRQPYGAKSDPIDAFGFEEFSQSEGLRGMLWANPAVLTAILLAATYKKDGKALNLGSVMSLGDIPFHYVTDRYGDQVALPCTERNLTTDPAQQTLARGFMPVIWIKGRNEVRLGSFNALGGAEIAGPWSDQAIASGKAPEPRSGDIEMTLQVGEGNPEDNGSSRDNQVAGLDEDEDNGATDPALESSLDDLLAGFNDTDDDTDDDGDDEMDPELAALLEGL